MEHRGGVENEVRLYIYTHTHTHAHTRTHARTHTHTLYFGGSQSQWPRGLRRRSAAARLLRLWVRIPPRAWIFFCCESCVLSGRSLCDELISRPEESY
jgi:hypothetical protein